MLLKQMLGEGLGALAVKMTDPAASQALFMKMVAAVAIFAYILVDVAATVLTVKFSYYIVLTERGEIAVDTALSVRGPSVNRLAKLLGCKLTVGILRQKVDQLALSVGMIGLFLHIWYHFPE